MSWDWYHKKDTNYFIRINLVKQVKKYMITKLEANTPFQLIPPVAFTYSGGRVLITHLERHKYMSRFKREFTLLRVHLDNGTFVPLDKLRTKHLLKISQILFN